MSGGSALGNMRYHVNREHAAILAKHRSEQNSKGKDDHQLARSFSNNTATSAKMSSNLKQVQLEPSTFSFSQPKALKALVGAICTSECSTNFVTNEFFKKLCTILNPRFILPGYKSMVKQISSVSEDITGKIKVLFLSINKFIIFIPQNSSKQLMRQISSSSV